MRAKRWRWRIRGSALIFALALGFSETADAYDAKEAARDHYARGLVLAGQSSYEGALQEFKEAYTISPQFAVLYNIAQAHVALGHATEAIDVLSRYLRDGRDRIARARREQVTTQIATLESRLATLLIATDRPGAKIIIDGREAGTTPLPDLIRIGAGAHRIVAISEGAAPVTRLVSIGEGERQHVRFELPAPSLEAAAAAARAAAAEAEAASVAAVRAARQAEAAARVAAAVAARPSPQATAAARKASLDAARAAEMAAAVEGREAAARGRATPAR